MNKNKYKDLSDKEIISLIIDGQQKELYSIIYSRYSRKVLDKCYSLLKNRKMAEEFTEEILVKAFEKLCGFKGAASFSSWLYSITYNYCIDYLRLKKKLHYPKWSSENEIPEIIDDADEYLEDITYEKLIEIFELIHPEEKALLLMKYHDNMSIGEIGKTLRISDDAAKMRLKRARTRVLYLYKEKFLKQ
ncbi:MAG: RNA polymerase sigma factor [Bacteroidales bacterium]|nr:RNA polymerase sigma factor [Bacteroidales bacterium]